MQLNLRGSRGNRARTDGPEGNEHRAGRPASHRQSRAGPQAAIARADVRPVEGDRGGRATARAGAAWSSCDGRAINGVTSHSEFCRPWLPGRSTAGASPRRRCEPHGDQHVQHVRTGSFEARAPAGCVELVGFRRGVHGGLWYGIRRCAAAGRGSTRSGRWAGRLPWRSPRARLPGRRGSRSRHNAG